ncbi:MAG: hypothetical protein IT437_05765 [Phycisphaerales bacterium]|nr:hypothetical protein [Phycisphaerales bacterium]
MPDGRPLLTLAHSPDPDDAFMWWPITGKVQPPSSLGEPRGHQNAPPRLLSAPVLDTGRFRYAAHAQDIEHLNREAFGSAPRRPADAAADAGNARAALPEPARGGHEITALSARTYADVADRYVITRCGGSFGEGYGPKVVVRAGSPIHDGPSLRTARARIAVPGSRTTAFLVLGLLMGCAFDFVEMPFARIIGAVAAGGADAGLIIHEGQLAFGDAGLRQVVDLGAWWRDRTGLPLPLGVNAIRRDLDDRFGPGTVAEIAATLGASVRYAAAHREESIAYARTFAMANLHREHAAARTDAANPARVERYIDLYVTPLTLDMGDAGLSALRRLFDEGAAAGLCPRADVRAV